MILMTKREAEYKPLLFTTTIRNPQRIKSLLYVLRRYDGQVLTEELSVTIIGELVRFGLYRPRRTSPDIKAKWSSTPSGEFAEYLLTDDDVAYVLKNNPQNHKEAGFPKGFPSRFATIFDFAKELGFVYYEPGQRIEFSEIGMKYADVLSIDVSDDGNIMVTERHPEYEQQAFLHAMCKYQRNNPFVRVLNDNVPLVLLLQTIKKLNADHAFNSTGISRKELPLLIFWKDNDAETLYKRIKQLRDTYGFNPSNEVIIDICVNEIMGNFKTFKDKSITDEYPDEFIRKMRLTGLISLRGAGRFIDINHNEEEKVNYVLAHYASYKKYTSEREYFNYMAKVDKKLFTITAPSTSPSQSEQLLKTWLKVFTWDAIKNELAILSKRKASKDDILKFIPSATRLEFLTALAIKCKLPDVRVIPNYTCDDTGLPTSTAGGNIGDIECLEYDHGVLVEVTMAEGRTQTIMEVWPIERHLIAFKEKNTQNAQCVFIAPSIYNDTLRQIKFVKNDSFNIIRPYNINDFIIYMEHADKLYAELS